MQRDLVADDVEGAGLVPGDTLEVGGDAHDSGGVFVLEVEAVVLVWGEEG